MMSSEIIINLIVICLITIAVGIILGLAIINVINRRLSEITINIPVLHEGFAQQNTNIQSPQIVKQVSPTTQTLNQPGQSQHTSQPDTQDTHNQSELLNVHTQSKLPNQSKISDQSKIPDQSELPDQPEVSNTHKYKTAQSKYVVGCNNNDDCNIVYGHGLNRCLVNRQCYCVEGSGQFCHYGPTYYKDPKDMSAHQLEKFKYHAHFDKMTLQDYINWLYLYIDEKDLLAPRHLINLEKLLKGMSLTRYDIPKDIVPPPMTAQQYFQQLYKMDQELGPREPDTGGLELPSNYMDYAEFEEPKNLKHLDDNDHLKGIEKYKNRRVIDDTRPKIEHDWNN